MRAPKDTVRIIKYGIAVFIFVTSISIYYIIGYQMYKINKSLIRMIDETSIDIVIAGLKGLYEKLAVKEKKA